MLPRPKYFFADFPFSSFSLLAAIAIHLHIYSRAASQTPALQRPDSHSAPAPQLAPLGYGIISCSDVDDTQKPPSCTSAIRTLQQLPPFVGNHKRYSDQALMLGILSIPKLAEGSVTASPAGFFEPSEGKLPSEIKVQSSANEFLPSSLYDVGIVFDRPLSR